MDKLNCWEFKRCGRRPGGEKIEDLGECPAVRSFKTHGLNDGINGGRVCWAIAGTLCGGTVQGLFADKVRGCASCDFFHSVHGEQGKRFATVKEIAAKLGARQSSSSGGS